MALPPQQSRRNAIRFDLQGDLKMDRLSFSRYVLQKELSVSTGDIDYLFAFPGGKSFEVILTTFHNYEACVQKFETRSSTSPALKNISLTPLMDETTKTINVLIYSERVRNEDVWTWMSRYCEVKEGTEVRDPDGIKTGGRRFQVKLRKEHGATQHLPSVIQLGPYRGTVFYAGQPRKCRKCGSEEHLAAQCTVPSCKRCRAPDHQTAECTAPVRCNLCDSEEHLFRDCPNAYANRLKQSTPQRARAGGPPRGQHRDAEPETTEEPEDPQHQPQDLEGEMDELESPQHQPHEDEMAEPGSPQHRPQVEDQMSRRLQVKIQGAEGILDKFLQDLPEQLKVEIPEQTLKGSSGLPDQPSTGDDTIQNHESEQGGPDSSESSGRFLASPVDLFRSLPNTLTAQTPQKRQLESSSEDSSVREQQQDWSNSFGSFLDPEILTNFSTVTQMKDSERAQVGPSIKKKKKKAKSGR